LLDYCAKEAISVEERGIAEQELEGGVILFKGPSKGLALYLLPST